MAFTPSRIYTIEGLKISLDVLKAVASLIPGPVSDLLDFAQKVIAAVETVRTSRDDCNLLRSRILQLLPVIIMAAKKALDNQNDIPQDLTDNIERFQKSLETVMQKLTKVNVDLNSKSFTKKVKSLVLANPYSEAIKQCNDELNWAVTVFEVASHIQEAVQLCDLTTKIEAVLNDHRLQSLPRSKYASHSSERPDKPPTCFEGTRTNIIEDVFDWIYDLTTDQIYFLNGIAGVGKTTIASTVAEKAHLEGLLGADFFFSRQGEADLRDPAKVFPTIAYQLALFDPEFGQKIIASLEKHPKAPYEGLKQQLDHLIIKPLSGIKRESKQTVVIVFDAFDECEPRGAKEILQLFLDAVPRLPFFLKIFLTGRPEDHILSVLDPEIKVKGLATTALHDIEMLIVKDDIRRYLRAKLAELPDLLRLKLAPDWAAEHEIELLIEKSDGLFIYAVTVIRFLSDRFVLDPRVQLDLLMSILQSNATGVDEAQPFRDLDALYMQLLRGALSSTNTPHVLRVLKAVLGTMVLLRDPLPQDALESLASLRPGQAESPLRLLQSVIIHASPPDNCPRIYHPSFPDFIQDPNRCTEVGFWIDAPLHESRMALACLTLINSSLRKGMITYSEDAIYNRHVQDLETQISSAYPPALQYACRHWASHLGKAKNGGSDVMATLQTFTHRLLLLWLEAMSWFGEIRLALSCIEISKTWAAASLCSATTQELLNDCHRFLLSQFSDITNYAPHLTRSVVPFIPHGTLLASTYRDHIPQSLKVAHGLEETWSPCLMVIDHQTKVAAVAFSPDGTRLACGPSTDGPNGEVQIIDTSSGVITLVIPERRAIGSISFSPDASRLVSTEWTIKTKPICVWDSTTGRQVATYEHASAAAISADGKLLASRLNSKIRVWAMDGDGDGDSQPVPVEWRIDADAALDCIKFSPNSGHIATSSSIPSAQSAVAASNCLIQLWDAETGTSLLTMNDHSDQVNDVAFSPDAHTLASASNDKTVRTWELETGSSISIFRGHTDRVNSLEFSPDGQYIVSCSDDRRILLWNATSAEVVAVFPGHADSVRSVAFSPDGTRIASGSADETVRIWDVAVGVSLMAFRDSALSGMGQAPQKGFVVSLALSPDDTQLAFSGSMVVGGLHVASIGTQEVVSLPLPTGPISFSPDNRWLASGGNHIQLWDRESRSSAPPLIGPDIFVNSLAFSPDSAYIASATDKGSIYIWAMTSRALVAMMKHRRPLYDFAGLSFSPDGGRLASGDYEGLIQIWDVATVAASQTSPSESLTPTSLELDSQSTSQHHPVNPGPDAKPLHIQHPQTTLPKSHELVPNDTMFSSDGSHIASYASGYGYSGREVFLWDLSGGAGERILEDPAMELSAVAIAFPPKDLTPATDPYHGAALNTPAVVTLSKSGQLQWQQGDQRRVWLLPSAISGDRSTEMTIKFLEARKIRCALAPKKGNVMVLDLQM